MLRHWDAAAGGDVQVSVLLGKLRQVRAHIAGGHSLEVGFDDELLYNSNTQPHRVLINGD
eukprot:361720-Chlamydomonas_euryale.AAC.9